MCSYSQLKTILHDDDRGLGIDPLLVSLCGLLAYHSAREEVSQSPGSTGPVAATDDFAAATPSAGRRRSMAADQLQSTASDAVEDSDDDDVGTFVFQASSQRGLKRKTSSRHSATPTIVGDRDWADVSATLDMSTVHSCWDGIQILKNVLPLRPHCESSGASHSSICITLLRIFQWLSAYLYRV